MKNIIYLIIALSISIKANAEYMVKYKIEPQPNSIIMVNWQSTSPYYTSWQSIGEVYGCSNWTPDESTIIIGQTFTQERDCSINQERLRQERELSSKGSYKDIGDPQLETRVEKVEQTRNNTGLMESWVSIGSVYGDWTNTGELYDCSNWSPDPSTIDNGISFTQNATDCKQDQVRTRQDREQETTTLAIRNLGVEIIETQVSTNQLNSRNNLGTKSNKVCIYEVNTALVYFYSYNTNEGLIISGYSGFPAIFTSKEFPTSVAGISRVGVGHYRYNDGNKIWNLTRGEFKELSSGNSFYEACFE